MLLPMNGVGISFKTFWVHRRLSGRAVERRITATSGWQENLIDQLIVFSFEWICGFNFPAHRNLRVSEGVENLLR
jgi:hypothetical protein